MHYNYTVPGKGSCDTDMVAKLNCIEEVISVTILFVGDI